MYIPTIFVTELTKSGLISKAAITKVKAHCAAKGYVLTHQSGNTLLINDYVYITFLKADGRDLAGCLVALDLAVIDLNADLGILPSPPAVVEVDMDSLVELAIPLYETDPVLLSASFKHEVEQWLDVTTGMRESTIVIGGVTLHRVDRQIRTRYVPIKRHLDALDCERVYDKDAVIMNAEWDYLWDSDKDSELADAMYFYWNDTQVESIYWFVNCLGSLYRPSDNKTLSWVDYFV